QVEIFVRPPRFNSLKAALLKCGHVLAASLIDGIARMDVVPTLSHQDGLFITLKRSVKRANPCELEIDVPHSAIYQALSAHLKVMVSKNCAPCPHDGQSLLRYMVWLPEQSMQSGLKHIDIEVAIYRAVVLFSRVVDDNVPKSKRKTSDTLSCRQLSETTQDGLPTRHRKGYKVSGHTCDRCGRSFSSLYILERHAITHATSKNYQCDICGKQYKHQSTLIAHKRVAHVMDESNDVLQKYTCRICGRRSKCQLDYEKHLRVHSKERPFVCNLCGRSFAQSNNLYRHHRLTHTGATAVRP
ncbi:Zinc finger Y-chromosomal protein, partial [Clonorchis sinensis]